MNPQNKIIFTEEMQHFAEYLTIRGYSRSTTQNMSLSTRRFVYWLESENVSRGSIRYADVTSYIQRLRGTGMRQKSQNTQVAGIKRYLDFLTEQGVLQDNPAASIKLRGTNQRIAYSVLSPEELESLYYLFPVQHKKLILQLAAKQNKIVTGLLVWQGLRSDDIGRLCVSDVKLREGKINIPGSRKMESRTLTLQSHQIIDMMDFVYETRKEILHLTKTESDRLFVGVAGSSRLYAMVKSVMIQLRLLQPRLKSVHHIRASVITHWLKQYNLRKVQHMAGHRYVSTTEKFKINDLEGLQEDLHKYHPIG
ncbi:MAG: tyrosine-type recombinase/integrase [Bacteroidota bacterium]